MDMKSAFINGDLQEEVYLEQPPGYKVQGKEHLVCHLKKDLYGLKQVPCAWYSKINNYFLRHGFHRSTSDPNLYIKVEKDHAIFIVLYIDDLMITGNETKMIQILRDDLNRTFEMTNLGLLHYFLGFEVWQQLGSIFISQAKYSWDILQ